MEKFLKRLKSAWAGLWDVPRDKVLHFAAGMLVVLVVSLLRSAAPYALFVGVWVALFKEFWDLLTGGEVDLWDAGATCIGAAAAQLAVVGYMFLW